ncbi:hypothetical protein KY316_01210 [Candidatus Woesearchaeota archaeon]|nr:hypothetical protein [Candidatus Woesearchaeota archaeon]
MATIYEQYFESNGTIVHVPAGLFYEIRKDDKGALFRCSKKRFEGAREEPSKGEAWQPLSVNLWGMLIQKPNDNKNIVSLVLEENQ